MTTVDDIILEQPEDGEIVEPQSLFPTPGPFELEIGCGKGGFLLRRAQNQPEARLLGIEWANKYFTFCADRMARWNMKNVRVMRTDAKVFVLNHLPPDCISVLHVYHPDPWPKKRQQKRRMIQKDFADAATRSLIDGSYWLVQTDHEEYYQQMRDVLGSHPLLQEVEWGTDNLGLGDEWSGTNYELKYIEQGRSIYRAMYRVCKQKK